MSDFIKPTKEEVFKLFDKMMDEPFEYEMKSSDKFFQGIMFAIWMLAKPDKYRWHDLRKDPEDLPTSNMECLVVMQMEYGVNYYACRCTSGVFHIEWATRIIAWREIEPFEEVEYDG